MKKMIFITPNNIISFMEHSIVMILYDKHSKILKLYETHDKYISITDVSDEEAQSIIKNWYSE